MSKPNEDWVIELHRKHEQKFSAYIKKHVAKLLGVSVDDLAEWKESNK